MRYSPTKSLRKYTRFVTVVNSLDLCQMSLADLADFGLFAIYFLFVYNFDSSAPANGTSPSSAGGNLFETFTSMSFRHFRFLPANPRLAF